MRKRQFIPKLDADASPRGRERYAVNLATSPNILGVIPRATTVIETELPYTVARYEDGRGGCDWKEYVHQTVSGDPVALNAAKIVKEG